MYALQQQLHLDSSLCFMTVIKISVTPNENQAKSLRRSVDVISAFRNPFETGTENLIYMSLGLKVSDDIANDVIHVDIHEK